MCWHVHSRHSFCNHVVCATYPFECGKGSCRPSCGVLNIKNDAYCLENNACVNCLVKEIKRRIGRKSQQRFANPWFGVAEFRAAKYYTEKRNEYTRRFIVETDRVWRKYNVREILDLPDVMGPQTLPFGATSQFREGLGPREWPLDLIRLGDWIQPHDIPADWHQRTPQPKSIQEVFNTSRALAGEPPILVPMCEYMPMHAIDTASRQLLPTNQFVECNSAYMTKPEAAELDHAFLAQQAPLPPNQLQGTYQGEDLTALPQNMPDHPGFDFLGQQLSNQLNQQLAIQDSNLLTTAPGEMPADVGGMQLGYQLPEQQGNNFGDMAAFMNVDMPPMMLDQALPNVEENQAGGSLNDLPPVSYEEVDDFMADLHSRNMANGMPSFLLNGSQDMQQDDPLASWINYSSYDPSGTVDPALLSTMPDAMMDISQVDLAVDPQLTMPLLEQEDAAALQPGLRDAGKGDVFLPAMEAAPADEGQAVEQLSGDQLWSIKFAPMLAFLDESEE